MTGRRHKRVYDEAFGEERREPVPKKSRRSQDDRLLEENRHLRRRLYDTDEHNRELQANLLRSGERIRERDHQIKSIQTQLSALEAQRIEEVLRLEEENLRLLALLSVKPSKEDTPSVVQWAVTEASTREPMVHKRTQQKLEDWTFHPKKSIIIMGDSNLARVPGFSSEHIQIDSYPGAQLFHVTEMLKKVPPTNSVKTVVLSAGLNNCLSRQTAESMIQHLGVLLKTAQETFPHANIHVPIINFSERLEMKRKEQLVTLNKYIQSNCNFLSGLRSLNFWTKPKDPVHWTSRTADLMIKHWLHQLNISKQ